MTVTFSDIEDAFDYVSSQPYGTNEAYLSLDTAQVYYLSHLGDSDELPDEFEESDRYFEILHKNDLVVGRSVVFEFTAEYAPQLARDGMMRRSLLCERSPNIPWWVRRPD